MIITVMLTDDAEQFLRSKVRKKYGHGAYVSTLLLAEKAREEARALERQRLLDREDWERNGVCVD